MKKSESAYSEAPPPTHQVLRPLAAQHHRTDNPTVEAKEKAVAVEEITIPKTREIRL